MVERYHRQVTPEVGAVNPSAGQDSNVLAQELEAFTRRMNDRLDKSAAIRAGEAGEAAGAAGDYEEQSNLTISGRAFNEAAETAHQAALQTDIRNSIIQFAVEHPDDPESFDVKVQGLEEGLKETPAKFRPFVQQRIADYAGRAKLQVLQRQQQKLRSEAMADLERGLDGIVEDAQTAAYEGGDDGLRLVEARRQELSTLLSKGIDAGFIDDGAAEVVLENFERGIIVRDTEGIFDRMLETDGLDAGAKAIAGLEKAKPSELGLDVDSYQKMMRTLRTRYRTEKSDQHDEIMAGKAAEAAEKRAKVRNVSDSTRLLELGYPVDSDAMQSVMDDLNDLEDPVASERFDRALNIYDQVREYRHTSPAQQQAAIVELRQELSKGGSVRKQTENAQRLAAMERTHAEVSRAIANDPRGYLNNEGIFNDDELNFDGIVELSESIAARHGAVGGESVTGSVVPLITAPEASRIASMYGAMPIEGKEKLLSAIVEGAGEERALATLGQISKTGAGSMTLLGAMSVQNRQSLVTDVLLGQEIRKSPHYKDPSRSDYDLDLSIYMGHALQHEESVKALYIDAINAKYAQLKQAEGDSTVDYNPGLYKQAMQAVIPVSEFNGKKVLIPPQYLGGDKWPEWRNQPLEEWADTWTPADFEGVMFYEDNPDRLMELVRDEGRLIEMDAGNGVYGVSIDGAHDGDPRKLLRSDGTVFKLDLKR